MPGNLPVYDPKGARQIPKKLQGIFNKALTSKATAIKAKCLDCCCYQRKEVALCAVTLCPLHPHRPYQPGSDDAGDVGEELSSGEGSYEPDNSSGREE